MCCVVVLCTARDVSGACRAVAVFVLCCVLKSDAADGARVVADAPGGANDSIQPVETALHVPAPRGGRVPGDGSGRPWLFARLVSPTVSGVRPALRARACVRGGEMFYGSIYGAGGFGATLVLASMNRDTANAPRRHTRRPCWCLPSGNSST